MRLRPDPKPDPRSQGVRATLLAQGWEAQAWFLYRWPTPERSFLVSADLNQCKASQPPCAVLELHCVELDNLAWFLWCYGRIVDGLPPPNVRPADRHFHAGASCALHATYREVPLGRGDGEDCAAIEAEAARLFADHGSIDRLVALYEARGIAKLPLMCMHLSRGDLAAARRLLDAGRAAASGPLRDVHYGLDRYLEDRGVP